MDVTPKLTPIATRQQRCHQWHNASIIGSSRIFKKKLGGNDGMPMSIKSPKPTKSTNLQITLGQGLFLPKRLRNESRTTTTPTQAKPGTSFTARRIKTEELTPLDLERLHTCKLIQGTRQKPNQTQDTHPLWHWHTRAQHPSGKVGDRERAKPPTSTPL